MAYEVSLYVQYMYKCMSKGHVFIQHSFMYMYVNLLKSTIVGVREQSAQDTQAFQKGS